MKYDKSLLKVVFILCYITSYSYLKSLPSTKYLTDKVKSDSYEALAVPASSKDTESRVRQKKIYNDLLKHMLKGGAVLRKFTEKFISDSNRLIYATANIKKGEILAIIPKKLTINVDSPLFDKYKESIKKLPQKPGNGLVFITLWILDNKQKLKDDPNASIDNKLYFQSFPEDMTNMPLLLNKEEKKLLETSKLLRDHIDDTSSKQDYDILRRFNIISERVSYEDYLAADYTFSTRNFYYANEKNEEKRLMIPFIDLFNYDDHKSNIADWKYELKKERFIIWARNDIKKGQEILLRYATNETLQHFYFGYGFTTKNMNEDSLELKKDNVKVNLSSKINKDGFKEALKPIITNFAKSSLSRRETLLKSYNFLLQLIGEYQEDYKTTIVEDRKRLAHEKNFNIQNILRLLISEKKILNYYKKEARIHLDNLK